MPTEDTIADAVTNNWVDRFAPPAAQPYLRLMRADRPIGTWLLLWPCWWSLALATELGAWPDPYFLLLFAVGAVLMRGAGCSLNDLVDRGFDAKVERTRARPLPSGAISPFQAVLFFLLLSFSGLLVLLQFNNFTILLGLSSLALVAIYPLMKRYTHWPQLMLGLTFNWGALMGWAAVHGSLAWPAILLYWGGVFWTLGYDTIYALQDKDDDALIGVKSTALLFKDKSRQWIAVFYAIAAVLFLLAGQVAEKSWFYYLVIFLFVAQFAWQVKVLKPESTESCLRIFRSNTYAGLILFVGLIAGNQL